MVDIADVKAHGAERFDKKSHMKRGGKWWRKATKDGKMDLWEVRGKLHQRVVKAIYATEETKEELQNTTSEDYEPYEQTPNDDDERGLATLEATFNAAKEKYEEDQTKIALEGFFLLEDGQEVTASAVGKKGDEIVVIELPKAVSVDALGETCPTKATFSKVQK